MEDKNLVIIGAGGQLGKALSTKYPNSKAVDSDTLDITDFEAVKNFDWSNSTHILNAAAYTNVDGAESPEGRVLAWKINGNGIANLVRIAQKHNLTLVHVSTDYVFDGTKDNHPEDEDLSPLSVYGASKAVGDLLVSTLEKHYILRTSWVIGDGKNFVRSIEGLADKDISPKVVNDQFGRLTFTDELVRAIDHILTNQVSFGTYNISNEGETGSWADIAREIYNQLGRNDLSVGNTTAKEYFANQEYTAPRPTHSKLDLAKIERTGFKPTDWKEDLKTYLGGV